MMNTKRQSTTAPTQCKICGDSAIYSYFGAISCRSCKVFFRRTAQRGLVNWKNVFSFIYIQFSFQNAFKCASDGHCEVNINNRYACTYCRLAKCFKSGMRTEMIRSSLSKTHQKRKTMSDQVERTSAALVRLNEPEQVRFFNYHS